MSASMEQVDFEPDGSAIVDCDVLEAAKENIQPLAKGRRVTTLAGILATPHVQRESRLSATKNRLRMNVQLALENSTNGDEDEDEDEMESADPLEAYCQYVYWVVENYPQGHSAESGLLELLEEATRVLKDHQGGKWRGDLRYLKLWVLYASYVEKPAVIFKFCMVNEIGTAHSLLYEEFAIALERAGRKAHADETYQVGIARKAQPRERLESKYKEFQKRMMSSPILPPQTDSSEVADSAVPVAQTGHKRKALTETKSTSRATTRMTRSSSRMASSSTPTTTPTLPQTSRPQSNARLEVYVDRSPREASSGAADEQGAPSAWSELGTRKSRVKENIKEATKAAGTTLRQAGRGQRAAAARRTPKIDVYRDPSPEAANSGDLHADGTVSAEPEDASSASPPAPKAKAGKAIEVFRDETHDAPSETVPSSSKPKGLKKSAIPVFRNDHTAASSSSPAVAPQTQGSKLRTTGQSAIPVFRDDGAAPDSATSAAKGKAKPTISIFRDDPDGDAENEPAPKPAAGSLKGKGKIPVSREGGAGVAPKASGKTPVFRDPESAPNKSRIAVFRDEDVQDPPVSKNKGKGKIPVFRNVDPEPEEPITSRAKSKVTVFRNEDAAEPNGASSNAKGKLPVFRDEEARQPAPSKSNSRIAMFRDGESAPAFTPYQDEEEPTSPTKPSARALSRTRSGAGVGLGIVGAGAGESKVNSEAEALRRDPLKNYAEGERVDLD